MNEEKKFTGRDALVALAIRHDGDWDAQIADIKAKRQPTEEEKAKEQAYKGGYITLLDDEYPDCLKRCPKPPVVLFYKGDLSLLQNGSRPLSLADTGKNTESDAKAVETLVGGLEDAFVLCGKSDTADLLKKMGKKRIFVVDNLDDAEIEDGELAISETPLGGKPNPKKSPFKTRIAAAMGDLLVLKAERGGEQMFEVGYSLSIGREVYTAPRALADNGTLMNNVLIQEGSQVAIDCDTLKNRQQW